MSKVKGGGAEDLDGLLRGLKLTEHERKGVRGAWRGEVETGNIPQAVGKLFSSKPGYAEGMVQSVGRIWCPQKGIRCKELGNNLFLFSFLQPGGKRRAILEGPWEFGGDLLVVVDFDDTKRLKDLEFTHIPVWIRVFDLPFGLMNAETGRRIGNSVGEVLEVDKDEDELAVGEYLRIKVLIDIRKPLFRGITMEKGKGEEEFWCRFKYEFVPNFCYSCGLLGHVEKDCDDGVGRREGKQFGEWLRVNPAKKKEGRGRWSEGGSSGGSQQYRKEASWGKNLGTKKAASGMQRSLEFEAQTLAEKSAGKESLPISDSSTKNASTNETEVHPTGTVGGPVLDSKQSTDHVEMNGEEDHITIQVNVGEQDHDKNCMDVDGDEDKKGEGEKESDAKPQELNKVLLHGENEKGKRGMADGTLKASKQATFKRRPRAISEKGESELPLGDEQKKRPAPEACEDDVEIKKKQCMGAKVSGGREEQHNNDEAGLLGQSRQPQ